MAIVGFYVHKTSHNADYKQLEVLADEAIKQGDLEKATLNC